MEFLSLSRRRSSPRNVLSDEEGGETDVFAGYYFPKVNTVFYKEEVRAAEEILNLTIEKNNIMAFCFSCTS